MMSFKMLKVQFPLIIFPVLAALLMSSQSSSRANNPVVWVPGQVDESIVTGQIKHLTVSLHANESVPDVHLWVSPEISQYVSISPTDIFGLASGTTKSFSITLNATTTVSQSSLEGAIILRASSFPNHALSRPLPVQISFQPAEKVDPQSTSYLNQMRGISFTYPTFGRLARVEQREIDPHFVVFSIETLPPTHDGYLTHFTIAAIDNTHSLDLEEWFDDNFPNGSAVWNSGAYEFTTLKNGMQAAILSRPDLLPLTLSEPISPVVALSTSTHSVIVGALSQDNQLDALGYITTSDKLSLLIDTIESISEE